ncbi:hypothetical protein Tco_1218275 [Tanacetum coccineum]
MASQDARLSNFEVDFKQQSKMTHKIDTVLKAITNRIAGTLPSDTVKNLKLSTSLVLSACSHPTDDPQCSTHVHGSINHPKQQSEFDKVVKVRTTVDATTKVSWVFEHTKQVSREEVIPFINSLRASFKDFENGLYSELNEVKTIFNQMEAVVEQCSIDKKYFDIQKKELSLDNDRLLDHIICQDVMNIMMHNNFVLVNVLPANHKCLIDGNLETKLDAKDVSIANLRKHIESLKGKNVVEKDATPNKAKVIAPGMFKLDLEHLSPKEVLVYITTACPSLTKPSEKLVAITPLNKNKKVRFTEPATSPSNTQKQADSHKTQDSNKLVLPSTGMKSSTSTSRSQPSGNTKNNRISRKTSSS